MYARNAVVLSAFLASEKAFTPAMNNAATSATVLNAVGVFYSTSDGNTETAAGYIAEAAGCLESKDIGDASDDEITGADAFITPRHTMPSSSSSIFQAINY